jgi:hypothetical protein
MVKEMDPEEETGKKLYPCDPHLNIFKETVIKCFIQTC